MLGTCVRWGRPTTPRAYGRPDFHWKTAWRLSIPLYVLSARTAKDTSPSVRGEQSPCLSPSADAVTPWELGTPLFADSETASVPASRPAKGGGYVDASMPVTRATVAVRGNVYDRLDDERREDETFSEAIARLLDGYRGERA